MKRLESYTENKVVAWARNNGVLTTKVLGAKGWPDRAFWFSEGAVVLVEFKRQGERPRKLQRFIMAQLRALQYDVIWTDSYEEAIEYLASYLG
jgi:hypothetical protein